MLAELMARTGQGRINPPVGYSAWWWVVLGVATVALVAMWWRTWRVLREPEPAPADTSLAGVRAHTLAALDGVEAALTRGEITERAAGSRCSGEVRRFVGIVTDGDADYSTLPQVRRAAVRDPRLAPVVELLEWLNPMLFDTTTPVDAAAAVARSRQVVLAWS